MKSIWQSSHPPSPVQSDRGRDGKCGRIIGRISVFALICILFACSTEKQISQSVLGGASQPSQPTPSGVLLTDADFKSKTPDQLAAYIFEHHGCKNCHTLGAGGKMGFTDRGKRIATNFEGCVRLLTAMNVIAQVEEKNRTAEDKARAARFQEYGCATCHQITPGKLGLTEYGAKLASFHLACTDVERIVAANRPK